MTKNWDIIFVLVTLALLGGCGAHCTEPEVRAANHGLVLDCNVDHTDSRHEICKVSTEAGDKFFRYVRCQ